MKNTNLYDQWRAMDDKRLASKPISTRLPVHVLARLNAISALFPTKTRTDILVDLIKSGLDSFEESLPPVYYSPDPVEIDKDLSVYLPVGANAEYKQRANKEYADLENELGNTNPQNLFSVDSKKA